MKKQIRFYPAVSPSLLQSACLCLLVALSGTAGFGQTRKGNTAITPTGQPDNMTVQVTNMHKVADETQVKLETEIKKLKAVQLELAGNNSQESTRAQSQLRRTELILERARRQAAKMRTWQTFTASQAQEVKSVFTDLNNQIRQLSAPAKGRRTACVEDCDRAFPGATWGDAIQYTFCTYCCFLGSIEVKKGDASVKINCAN